MIGQIFTKSPKTPLVTFIMQRTHQYGTYVNYSYVCGHLWWFKCSKYENTGKE